MQIGTLNAEITATVFNIINITYTVINHLVRSWRS